jgi:hypothetical protein
MTSWQQYLGLRSGAVQNKVDSGQWTVDSRMSLVLSSTVYRPLSTV